MSAIRLERLTRVFPNGHAAARDIDLEIRDGELVVLVGPSGCGKSTLLRMIAGLESPTSGRVLLGDADVTHQPPQVRDMAMVFQSYALYPHMSVRDNLAYGLKVRRVGREDIDRRIAAVVDALELVPLLDRRPSQLSGGQRQRVALGRAMVREPKAFLFDEPLSNLDPALRTQARAELLRLHRRLNTTIVYVTHDQEEAMTLADRVAVMRAGAIEQYAPPLEVYARPVNTFVAQFIGSPPMNLVPAPVPGIETSPGTLIGIRPHDLALVDSGPLSATVDLVEPRGHDVLVHLTTDTAERRPVVAVAPAPSAPRVGARVGVECRRAAIHFFDSGSGARRAQET